MPKPDTDSTRKENYGLISLTSTVVKVQNKILASQTPECIRKIKHHVQVEFILGMQEWFKEGQNALRNVFLGMKFINIFRAG